MSRYIIFGASRGLGSEISRLVSGSSLLLISRDTKNLEDLSNELSADSKCTSFDLTNIDKFDELSLVVKKFDPTHIYYVAGGGPHGKFGTKEFKDHLWAYRLNLLFPAKLLHWSLNNLNLKQFILVGSSVAESKADPLASSYSSAKHGLKGLVTSINAEGCDLDLRLFSPPYMETDLLPKNSHPYTEAKVRSPSKVAEMFYKWANDADGLKHYLIEVE